MQVLPDRPDRVDPETVQPVGLNDAIGFGALVFFLFSVFSSTIDFIGFLHVFHTSRLVAGVGMLCVAVSGRVTAVLKHGVSLMFIALTLWDAACVPFAVWPGGAARILMGDWLVAAFTVFLAAGLVANHRQFPKIAHVIAYASIILAAVALGMNSLSVENRLMLPGSRYTNPNDLASILLTAMPFLGFMAVRTGNGIRRPLALGGAVLILLVVSRTGSRAALIAGAVAMVALFFRIGAMQKVKLVVVGVVAFGILAATLPGQLAERFTTVFGSEDVYDQPRDEVLRSSIESAYSRRMLLMDSLTVTWEHPVFGVGLGNFPVAQNDLAKARGEAMGNWHLTHNTYTQVSSESGVPGLALFLLALLFSFRAISRVLRMTAASTSPAGRDIRMFAVSLRISLLVFLTCAFFASLAYLPILTALCGLTISLELCTRGFVAAAGPPPHPAGMWQPFPAGGKRPLASGRATIGARGVNRCVE
jgi:O-antigen ligase